MYLHWDVHIFLIVLSFVKPGPQKILKTKHSIYCCFILYYLCRVSFSENPLCLRTTPLNVGLVRLAEGYRGSTQVPKGDPGHGDVCSFRFSTALQASQKEQPEPLGETPAAPDSPTSGVRVACPSACCLQTWRWRGSGQGFVWRFGHK